MIAKKFCKTDTDLFIELFQKTKTANPERKKDMMLKMLDLYQDGLLPLDIYEEYTVAEREYLSAIFLETAHKVVAFLNQESNYKAAEALLLRIIKLDPYNEHAYKTLIKLYWHTGQTHLADFISRQFARRYEKEMGQSI